MNLNPQSDLEHLGNLKVANGLECLGNQRGANDLDNQNGLDSLGDLDSQSGLGNQRGANGPDKLRVASGLNALPRISPRRRRLPKCLPMNPSVTARPMLPRRGRSKPRKMPSACS